MNSKHWIIELNQMLNHDADLTLELQGEYDAIELEYEIALHSYSNPDRDKDILIYQNKGIIDNEKHEID